MRWQSRCASRLAISLRMSGLWKIPNGRSYARGSGFIERSDRFMVFEPRSLFERHVVEAPIAFVVALEIVRGVGQHAGREQRTCGFGIAFAREPDHQVLELGEL